jgi:hypothetical protein
LFPQDGGSFPREGSFKEEQEEQEQKQEAEADAEDTILIPPPAPKKARSRPSGSDTQPSEWRRNSIVVQDPFLLSRNCCAGVGSKTLRKFQRVRTDPILKSLPDWS